MAVLFILLAGAIQYCLQRYNQQEKYCQHVINNWKTCRDKARAEAGSS